MEVLENHYGMNTLQQEGAEVDMSLGTNTCGTTMKAVVETREDKIRHTGRKSVNSVPLGGTATTSFMAPYLSPAEERPRKKFPTQHIGRRIAEAETVS